MRVLLTGASGTLGQALLPRLAAAGHTMIAFDLRRSAGAADLVEGDWVEGDLRDAEQVRQASDGAELVVHTAALHGIHLATHTAREFYDLNLTGTFNVWQAAVEQKVRGFVFSSTMGVYGLSRRPRGEDDVVVLSEETPALPAEIYGWTKVAGEELCRYHLREHGIPSVALRYGMFVPEPFFRYGIRLLYGGVHEEDVADSVMAAIAGLEKGAIEHDVLNVESPLPFAPADGPDLRRDPLAAVERHYPGASDLLRARGVRSLKPVTELFAVGRLEARLGLRPRHDFGEWLAELAERPDERADGNPPWP